VLLPKATAAMLSKQVLQGAHREVQGCSNDVCCLHSSRQIAGVDGNWGRAAAAAAAAAVAAVD